VTDKRIRRRNRAHFAPSRATSLKNPEKIMNGGKKTGEKWRFFEG
jgi:hypothetical protein